MFVDETKNYFAAVIKRNLSESTPQLKVLNEVNRGQMNLAKNEVLTLHKPQKVNYFVGSQHLMFFREKSRRSEV